MKTRVTLPRELRTKLRNVVDHMRKLTPSDQRKWVTMNNLIIVLAVRGYAGLRERPVAEIISLMQKHGVANGRPRGRS